MLPALMLPPALVRLEVVPLTVVLFPPGTGPSGPGRVAFPAAAAGVAARFGMELMSGWPATGVLGPSDVTGGAAPREDGSLPAAVSGVTSVPAWGTHQNVHMTIVTWSEAA